MIVGLSSRVGDYQNSMKKALDAGYETGSAIMLNKMKKVMMMLALSIRVALIYW